MSVIVRTPSGEIKLLCKGAVSHFNEKCSLILCVPLHQDSVINSRLQGRMDIMEETKVHVNTFGNEGNLHVPVTY